MNNMDLSDNVSKVYQLVATSLLFFTVGILLGHVYNLLIFSVFVLFGSMIGFAMSNTENGKWFTMNTLATVLGVITQPLVLCAFEVDSLIIPTAALGTAGIFAGFSFLAKYIKDQDMVAIVGLLYGSLFTLVFGVVVMLFFNPSNTTQLAYTMFGLLTFCAYISYDTKVMYKRFKEGRIDHYAHAMDLFLDIINVFVKLVDVMILLSNKKKTDEKMDEKKLKK